MTDIRSNTSFRVGRKGGGPGEFMFASLIVSDSVGNFAIGDLRRYVVSLFDRTGRFVSSSRLPGQPLALLSLRGSVVTVAVVGIGTGSGPGILRIELGEESPAPTYENLFEIDSALRVVERSSGAPSSFLALASREDGGIVAASPLRYRIVTILPGGKRGTIFERPDVAAEPLSRAEIEVRMKLLERVRSLSNGAMDDKMFDELARGIGEEVRPFYPLGGLRIDNDGRLWVITTRDDHPETTEVDIFSKDGTFLGTIEMGGAVKSLAFRGPRLAALVLRGSEGDGSAAIEIYNLRERAGGGGPNELIGGAVGTHD